MHVWRGPMVVVVMLRSLAEMDGLRATVAANRFLAQCAPHTRGGMGQTGSARWSKGQPPLVLMWELPVAGGWMCTW